MISVAPGIAVLVILAVMFALMIMGCEVAFSMGAAGVLSAFLFWGPAGMKVFAMNAFDIMSNFSLVPLPLFLFMSVVLERSGIAEKMFTVAYNFLGGIPGGLAAAIIVVGAVLGAMVGVVATGIVTMALMALSFMLKLGYDRKLTEGAIMAGGGLAVLIPPSGIFILYGAYTGTSIGKLFAGGLIPGIILAGIYIVFILISCKLKPSLGPAIPKQDRPTNRERFASLKGIILPTILVLLVLGSIMLGLATPTEAASLGALGSVICAAINRSFSWKLIREACERTFTLSGIVMWVMIGAYTFKSSLAATGGIALIQESILGFGSNKVVILIGMVVIFLVLGMLIDEISVMMVTFPIFIPILLVLNIDMLWFGVLFLVTVEVALLSPPFGYCLFVMKSVVDVAKIKELWAAVVPFIICIFALIVCMFLFPKLATWLPGLIF